MYVPSQYREEDWDQAAYLVKTYPLATLITTDSNGQIIANHIPFFLKTDTENGGKKLLIAHIAKSNHQLPSLQTNSNVLVIFQSANSYITPDYYPGKPETHKYVPTWDFASVHIYGSSKVIDDFDFVRDQLNNLTNQEEKAQKKEGEKAWKVSDAPEGYLKVMQRGIVGLEIQIESFECKYKFEQEKKSADTEGVIKGLALDGKTQLSKLAVDANARADQKKALKASNTQ